MKKLKHFFEYIAAFLVISLLLFAIVSAVIVKFYGDEVQEYAMDFVNEQIDTKIAVDEVGISLFRKFPNTSVFLNNVTLWSGHQLNRHEFSEINTDTLLHAERIYVQFNILDLARKKFNIKGLEIQNGSCNLLIDSMGKSNFSIAKKTDKKDNSSFQLRGVQFKKVEARYINKAKSIEAEVLIDQVLFEGAFEKDAFDMKTKGEFFIESMSNHGANFLRNQELKSDLSLEVKNNHYKISKGSIILGDIITDISGTFLLDRAEGADLDLQISGQKINLGFISELLEKQHLDYHIRGNGDVNLKANISGIIAPSLYPHIEAEISSSRANLQTDFLASPIENLNFRAVFSNGTYNIASSSSLNIEYLKANIEQSNIELSLLLKDFTSPEIRAKIKGNIHAKDLVKIIPTIPVDIETGSISPDITLKGKIRGLREGNITYNIIPEGIIEYQDISFSPIAIHLPISNLGGSIELSQYKWTFLSTLSLGESSISLDLHTGNLLSDLYSASGYHAEGQVYGGRLNIDELISFFQKAEKEENSTSSFPENISLDIDFGFDQITFGELETKHINGNILYKYPGLYVKPFYIETMDGEVNASISLFDLDKDKHQASLKSVLNNIDISHLFSSFENFGQDFLTKDNIAGRISGEINFLTALDHQFKPVTSDIISETKITISNGELNNFKPMMEMSKFLKINELDHIQFSNISNTILIKDDIINIPQMDILSTAFSMNAMGTHSFNKTFDYHLAIKLSDLLFNKAKSSKKREFDVALDEDDKRTLFLLLYDEGDGMLIDFDEEQAMKKIKNDIRDEKTELKLILNEEFGIFKKDENVQQQKDELKPKFNFEFSDDLPADSIPKQEEKKKWWKREKKESKKPDFEFVIDSSEI